MNATATKPVRKSPAPVRDHAERDALILEHLHLVSAIATHVQRSLQVHTDLDDLVTAGTMGLIDAATKYCPDKNVPFPTYAKHRIKGAILDSLRQLDCASRDLRRRYKQMETVTRDLTAKLDRTPTQNEVAEQMGITGRRWQALMLDFRNLGLAAVQLKTAGDREDRPEQEAPCPAAHIPDRVFARSQMREKLAGAMKILPERYQQVVKLYYEQDLSMKEIGNVLGVNESRVSQIHKSALHRMQTALVGSGIHSAAAF